MKEPNYKWHPDKDYRFFLLDPINSELTYFKTVEERDAAAHDLIMEHLDDGWSEDVDQIVAGQVTHHTVRRDVVICPKQEDYDTDEDYEEALGEYGSDEHAFTCNYKLAPLEEADEEIPTMKERK